MTVNTAYLNADSSTQSNLNTPILLGGLTGLPSDISSQGTLTVAGNLIVGGTQTDTGAQNFASTLSVRGITSLFAQVNSTSNISAAGTLAVGSTLSVHGNFSLNGLGPITLVSLSSTTIVATTALKNRSTTTNYTDNAVAVGDLIDVGPSNLSNGLTLQAFSSTASTITFSYSNSSGADAAQVAINCRYMVWRF